MKTEKNALFIKSLIEEIKLNETWSGPRIVILGKIKKVTDQDEKLVIINDFHLLPSSGHAGD